MSHETTFAYDQRDPAVLEEKLKELATRVARRLHKSDMVASTVGIKVRYFDFTTLSRQMTLACPTDDEQEIQRVALVLFRRVWKKRQTVRLLGVAAHHLSASTGQLRLWQGEISR